MASKWVRMLNQQELAPCDEWLVDNTGKLMGGEMKDGCGFIPDMMLRPFGWGGDQPLRVSHKLS